MALIRGSLIARSHSKSMVTMEILFVFVLGLSACVFGQDIPAEFECPEDPDGGCIAGRHPYPYDCKYYIQCPPSCEPNLVLCPNDYEYSVAIEECLPPEMAECTVSTTIRPTTPPLDPFDCPKNPEQEDECLSHRYPVPHDCSVYFLCFANCDSELRQCPNGHDFSPVLQECLPPEMAQCEVSTTLPSTAPTINSTTPSLPSTTTIENATTPDLPSTTSIENSTNPDLPSTSPSLFDCPKDPEDENKCVQHRYAHPLDCTKYYTCIETCQWRLDECRQDLEFGDHLQECVHPSIAQCEVTTTPEPTTPSLGPIECEEDPDLENNCLHRRYPHPNDCTKYYACFYTCQSRLDECREGLEFSDHFQECVHPVLSNCTVSTTVTPTRDPAATEEITTDGTALAETTEHGKTTELKPTDSDSTNSELSSDYSTTKSKFTVDFTTGGVSEITEVTPEDGTVHPSTPSGQICEADSDIPGDCVQDRLPYPTDCSLYYACFFNCSYRITPCTEEGTEFSPVVKECLDPEVAQCVVSTLSPPISQPPTPLVIKDELDVDFPCQRLSDNTCRVGRFAMTSLPHHYVTCFSGCDYIIEKCRPGQEYSSTWKICT